jgi:hypothetical protein
MDDRHKLEEERPPEDAVVADDEARDFKCSRPPTLVISLFT